jgi:hypothetical protein
MLYPTTPDCITVESPRPFLAARDFLASLDSPDVQLLTDTLGSIWEATPDDFPLKPGVQLYRREIRQ